jgi:Ino eighty subunit 1
MQHLGEHPQHRYPARKASVIKRADGEAFTRQDVQHDLLNYIFSDDSKVFSELKTQDTKAEQKLTFGELYVNTLIRSSKCSKPLRDKILENRTFSRDFAKVALLVNVGRINSTQACLFYTLRPN